MRPGHRLRLAGLRGLLVIGCVLAALCCAATAAAQDAQIEADATDVAGVTSQGGSWAVTGSLGQYQPVGTSVGDTYEVEGGLWHRGAFDEPGDDDDTGPDDDDAAPDDDDGAPDDDDLTDDDDDDDDDTATPPDTGGCEDCSLGGGGALPGALILLPAFLMIRRKARGTRR